MFNCTIFITEKSQDYQMKFIENSKILMWENYQKVALYLNKKFSILLDNDTKVASIVGPPSI